VRGDCAIPIVTVNSVINATIEYTDFIEDVLSMNYSTAGVSTLITGVDYDSEIARLGFRLP
jgi:hypothetical protein